MRFRNPTVRRAFAIVLIAGAGGLALGRMGTAGPVKRESQLVTGMLAGVKRPEKAQFPNPLSAAEFLVEQVRQQNIDEATRVFPILEAFEHATCGDVIQYHGGAFSSVDVPMPGADYSNAQLALRYLSSFEFLSVSLLEVQAQQVVMLKLRGPDANTDAFEKKLDRSRLAAVRWKGGKVVVQRPLKPANLPGKAMGMVEEAEVEANIRGVEKEHAFRFRMARIGECWRMVGCEEVTPQ